MAYGHLTLICGPMFSGKTTELLKKILWAKNGLNQHVAVLKTAFDTRYGREMIVSHEGLRAESEAIHIWPNLESTIESVFLDEVQFFAAPRFDGDILDIVSDLLARGIAVTAAGLDMDWQGKPFTITGQLAAMADEVIKLKSACAVCGRPATKSYRKVASTETVLLGGTESYEPRCTRHWSEPREADLFDAVA